MKTTIFTTLLVLISLGLSAQVSINTDGADPDASALLDVKSTNRGLLPPRMTQAHPAPRTSQPAPRTPQLAPRNQYCQSFIVNYLLNTSIKFRKGRSTKTIIGRDCSIDRYFLIINENTSCRGII